MGLPFLFVSSAQQDLVVFQDQIMGMIPCCAYSASGACVGAPPVCRSRGRRGPWPRSAPARPTAQAPVLPCWSLRVRPLVVAVAGHGQHLQLAALIAIADLDRVVNVASLVPARRLAFGPDQGRSLAGLPVSDRGVVGRRHLVSTLDRRCHRLSPVVVVFHDDELGHGLRPLEEGAAPVFQQVLVVQHLVEVCPKLDGCRLCSGEGDDFRVEGVRVYAPFGVMLIEMYGVGEVVGQVLSDEFWL